MNEPVETVGQVPAMDGPAVAAAGSVGARLASARKARGLDIDAVVGVLRYSRRQIEALEADQHASLPPPAVVRGMVRAYARHVGLDATALLGDLPATAGASVLVGEFMDVPFQAQSKARQGLVWWSVGLIVLAVAVWLGADRWVRRAPAPVPDAAPLAVDSAEANAVPTEPSAVPKGGQAADSVEANDSPAAQAHGTAPALMPALTPSVGAQGGDVTALALEPIEIEFRGRSWIEVRDARDELLATGAFEAGVHKRLQAQPPVRVVVGSASVVRLQWRGSPVDLAAQASGNVARVTLQ